MPTPNKKWLTTKAALEYFRIKNNGRPITKIGLIGLSTKHQLCRKAKDGFHWEFSQTAIDEYLDPPSEKYKGVSEITALYQIDKFIVYQILRKGKVKIKRYRGLLYAHEKEFDREYKEICYGRNKNKKE